MDFEIFAEGLGFPEGPVWMEDGSIILVEIYKGCITRIWGDGKTEVIAETGGGPNGAAIGPDGALWICNNGGFKYHERDGLLIPGHCPDDYSGGRIERVDLTTGKVERVLDPNGVGLSPDEKTVYMADTMTARRWAVDLAAPGQIEKSSPFNAGRVVATMPSLQYFDSLAVAASGNICVATILNGGITTITPDGDHSHIAFPDPFVTNICFGDDGLNEAWVTLSGTGKLAKCRWPEPGLKLNYYA